MRLTVMLLLFWALVPLGACGNGADSHDETQDKSSGPGHDEHGPHGGELIELGDHVAHLEVVHDANAGTLTLYALDSDLKPTTLSKAPVLNLPTDTGPKQIVATERDGGKAEWVFSDPALKGEPEGARLRVVFGGVTYTPDIPHDHEGHGDH